MVHNFVNYYQMNIKKFLTYLKTLELINDYENAKIIIDDIKGNITDVAQINTLNRILERKPHNQNINCNTVYKDCPHCGKKNNNDTNSSYIICGYSHKGYDWKGCEKDWCFRCGKKLCKHWSANMLFNKLNRYHDAKCCKNYCHKHGEIYDKNTYCMCSQNEFVVR